MYVQVVVIKLNGDTASNVVLSFHRDFRGMIVPEPHISGLFVMHEINPLQVGTATKQVFEGAVPEIKERFFPQVVLNCLRLNYIGGVGLNIDHSFLDPSRIAAMREHVN
jgi:hypothetical protein